MKEFYDITKIEIHIFTTEIMNFELVDISYKTHPDWRVIDAVYSSCSIPIIFSPLIKDNKCYCDGGLLLNYPVDKCIENGANPSEVIGLCSDTTANDTDIMNENSSLLDYVIVILKKVIAAFLPKVQHVIPNEFKIGSPEISIYDIVTTTSNTNRRIELIQNGVDVITNVFTSTENMYMANEDQLNPST